MLTRTRTIITCTAVAAAAGLAASIAAPALATVRLAPSTVTGPGGALRLTHQTIGRITAAPISNRDFAGYQTTVTTGSATVSAASFTVPTLSCTTKDRAIAPSAAVWVNNYRTLSAAFVFTGCVNGTAKYFPGLVSNGREFDHTTTPFAAGDVIDLTTKVSTAGTKIIVTDVTTGVTVQHRGRGASAKAAFIGDVSWANRNGSRQGVPNFGKLRFTNCLIDGKSLGSWHPKAYQRVNGSGRVEIATGGLWPGGTTFNTFYRRS